MSILSEELFVLVEEYGWHEGGGVISAFFGGGAISELLDVGIVAHDHARGFLEVQSRSGFLDERGST